MPTKSFNEIKIKLTRLEAFFVKARSVRYFRQRDWKWVS
jgi:hypothetical protein